MGSTTGVLERVGIALATMGPGAVLLNAALRGFRVAAPAALLTAAALGVAGTAWLARRLHASLAEVPARRALVAAWCLLAAVVSIGVTARLSLFMVDSARVEDSIYPRDLFFVQHSCLSAYFQAGRLQRAGVPNLYEHTHYEGPRGKPKPIDGFVIDAFLSRRRSCCSRGSASRCPTTRGLAGRLVGIEGALVASTLLAVGLWIGGRPGRRVLWLTPLVWLSMPTLVTLQFGNFQLVGIAGAILAMLAFESDRNILGGALLAPLALSKVFPGILVLLLLWQRRWRAAAWTAGFTIVVFVGSVLVLGEAPYRALLSYHLPRLSSGAAVETILARPDAMATNTTRCRASSKSWASSTCRGCPSGWRSRYPRPMLVLLGATAVAANGCPSGCLGCSPGSRCSRSPRYAARSCRTRTPSFPSGSWSCCWPRTPGRAGAGRDTASCSCSRPSSRRASTTCPGRTWRCS